MWVLRSFGELQPIAANIVRVNRNNPDLVQKLFPSGCCCRFVEGEKEQSPVEDLESLVSGAGGDSR